MKYYWVTIVFVMTACKIFASGQAKQASEVGGEQLTVDEEHVSRAKSPWSQRYGSPQGEGSLSQEQVQQGRHDADSQTALQALTSPHGKNRRGAVFTAATTE